MSVYDRVLITGAGGMLAQALAMKLRARGVEPLMLDHASLDITDAPAVQLTLDKLDPTLVLNSAAYTKVDLCETDAREIALLVNGAGPTNLAQATRAPIVHFSTDFVFDGAATQPYRPNDRVRPLSSYGQSKLMGEGIAAGGAALVIRTSWLYGPGGPNFVQTMLKVARAGKPLKVVNDQTGSPTFTYDLADVTLDLIDKDARGIYHATNAGQTTWFDFARAIFDEFGVTADLSPTTSAEWKAQYPHSANRPAYSVLDCTETERLIGRKLPDWRDALRRYRGWIELRNTHDPSER